MGRPRKKSTMANLNHLKKTKDKVIKKNKILTTKDVLKGSRSKVPTVKIPQSKFENALRLLRAPDEEKEVWMSACSKPIHAIDDRKFDVTKNTNLRLLAEARICLLEKDWKSLAKILSVARPVSPKEQFEFLPTFLKYGIICLYYNKKKDLIKSFLQAVVQQDDGAKFFNALTSFH